MPGTASETGLASVGLGAAAGRPPKEEQVPTATVARADPQTWRAISNAVTPAMVQYAPPAPVGIDPSITAMYSPGWLVTMSCQSTSAWSPAAAMMVSW